MPVPSKFLTLLFSDIEGSSRLWEDERKRMPQALAAYDALARRIVEENGGAIVKTSGDGMFAVFEDPVAALRATLTLQLRVGNPAQTNGVTLRVRSALHAGTVEPRDGDYFGPPVNRASRIVSVAHGGQVLLSQIVATCVRESLPADVSLRELGIVRLRDLALPEVVYQVVHPLLRAEFPALRSLEATPNNLPQQLTSFIGRERDLEAVRALLKRSRLLTLIGVGGLGKTRLSLQVAADVLDDYADGIWTVELAAVSDERRIAQTVASVLNVKEDRAQGVRKALCEFVRDRRLLLVFDNCEHLAQGCATLVSDLLQAGAGVQVLATSREPLHVAGEVLYSLPPLATPPSEQRFVAAALAQYEAVRLFAERAIAAHPTFELNDQNADAVADICRRVDGIPLALELAAARVRALSVTQIDARLSDCFRLLRGGDRTALPRQQTLRACIDWSYDLLRDDEKLLLQRLSVFAGGWTLDASEKVCSEQGFAAADVLDLLTSLHDKSLVFAEQREDSVRFRLLETVRQYAREKLEQTGTRDALRQAHCDYFIDFAAKAEPKLLGDEQAEWLRRLEDEHDNLRASLEWSLAGPEPTSALKLCGALQRFWSTHGHLSEGREWCARTLEKRGAEARTRDRALTLNGVGQLAYAQGDFPAAHAGYAGAVEIYRELGDRRGTAASLNNLGNVAFVQGELGAARPLFEECLAIVRELGERGRIAGALHNLGSVAHCQRDFATAHSLYSEALALTREVGDHNSIARALVNLAILARDEGDLATARTRAEESLAISRDVGDRGLTVPCLELLGDVDYARGEFAGARARYEEGLQLGRDLGDRWSIAVSLEGLAAAIGASVDAFRAARIWGAVERLREEIGAPIAPNEKPHYDRRVGTARSSSGDAAGFERAWHEGRALTLEAAMDVAMEPEPSGRPATGDACP